MELVSQLFDFLEQCFRKWTTLRPVCGFQLPEFLCIYTALATTFVPMNWFQSLPFRNNTEHFDDGIIKLCFLELLLIIRIAYFILKLYLLLLSIYKKLLLLSVIYEKMEGKLIKNYYLHLLALL